MVNTSIQVYGDLIRNLPFLEQAFETRKETWEPARLHSSIFSGFLDRTFTTDRVQISRADCFQAAEGEFSNALFTIILWGYPANMRGRSFERILNNLPAIEASFPAERNLTEDSFSEMLAGLKRTGIGLSTITKVLYFFRYTLNGLPCLILDSRIIDVLNSTMFREFEGIGKINEFNKGRKYAEYLKLMQNLAASNDFSVDQLEFFLFAFGKNLKRMEKPVAVFS